MAILLWAEGIDIVLCLEEHRRKSLADHMKKLKQRHHGALHRAQNPCQMRNIDLLFCKPVFDPWTIGVIIPTVITFLHRKSFVLIEGAAPLHKTSPSLLAGLKKFGSEWISFGKLCH